jgi:hypothetical protein
MEEDDFEPNMNILESSYFSKILPAYFENLAELSRNKTFLVDDKVSIADFDTLSFLATFVFNDKNKYLEKF